MAFTYFFRDRETLDLLIEHAIPSMRGQRFIRVWDAGCAYGPEPYTLAIMFRRAMSEFTWRNLKIVATDIDPAFQVKLQQGIYSAEETGRIPQDIKAEHFTACDGGYRLADEIRAKVDFIAHDLLSLRPVSDELSLIVCKNVLLHFPAEKRVEVIRMFRDALRTGGYLVMENTQEMPEVLAASFHRVSTQGQVYTKNEVV